LSLYAITSEMQSLLDAFDSYGAESPEAEAAIREHAAAIAEAFDAKADGYAAFIRTCEKRAEGRRDEAERMLALARSDNALADRLRAALLAAMQTTGRTKVDTERFRIAVRANGGKIPVIVEDEAALPTEFRVPVVTERIDRDGLRAALEAGRAVDGARLGERGTRLDIR
jgi:mRNA-degrading endonuclease toxin of MazEF toxin-antitoxin module